MRGTIGFSCRLIVPPVHQRLDLSDLLRACPVQGEVPSSFVPGRSNAIIKAQLWDLEGDGLVSVGTLQRFTRASQLWFPTLWESLHLAKIFHFLWESGQLSGGPPPDRLQVEPSVILRRHQVERQQAELGRVIDRPQGHLRDRRFYVPSSSSDHVLEVVYADASWYIRVVDGQEARQLRMRRFLALKPTRQ